MFKLKLDFHFPVLFATMFLNTRYFHLNDFKLCLMGLCFGIAASITYALSSANVRNFYIAGAIESGFGTFLIALRASMMKLVESHETAKSNAIIGATEGTLYFLFGSLYSFIYEKYLGVFAGAFFFVTTSCYTYCFFAVLVVYYMFRRKEKEIGMGVSNLTIKTAL